MSDERRDTAFFSDSAFLFRNNDLFQSLVNENWYKRRYQKWLGLWCGDIFLQAIWVVRGRFRTWGLSSVSKHLLCFLEEVKALDYQSRWRWIMAASLVKVCPYVALRVLAQAMGHTDPGSCAPERRGLSGRQRFFRLFYFMVMWSLSSLPKYTAQKTWCVR